MKKLFFIWLVVLFTVSLLAATNANAQDRQVNWEAFSKNLVVALGSDNEGLQLSAMGMVIRYADQLDVKDAAWDVLKVFKTSKDRRIRRLAMVTLYHIKHDNAMYHLKRLLAFEGEEGIREHLGTIVNTYYAEKAASQEKEKEILLAGKR